MPQRSAGSNPLFRASHLIQDRESVNCGLVVICGNMPPEFTAGYQHARLLVVVSTGLTVLWKLGIPLKGRLPLLDIDLSTGAAVLPQVLPFVLAYSMFRLSVEWAQSAPERRKQTASRVDLSVTWYFWRCLFGHTRSSIPIAQPVLVGRRHSISRSHHAGYRYGDDSSTVTDVLADDPIEADGQTPCAPPCAGGSSRTVEILGHHRSRHRACRVSIAEFFIPSVTALAVVVRRACRHFAAVRSD